MPALVPTDFVIWITANGAVISRYTTEAETECRAMIDLDWDGRGGAYDRRTRAYDSRVLQQYRQRHSDC